MRESETIGKAKNVQNKEMTGTNHGVLLLLLDPPILNMASEKGSDRGKVVEGISTSNSIGLTRRSSPQSNTADGGDGMRL